MSLLVEITVPGGNDARRDDLTLKAFHKIITVLSSELRGHSKDNRVVAGWRDSKLTKLCQAGLGCGGKHRYGRMELIIISLIGQALVLVPLSGSPADFGETSATLEFAQKIRLCRGVPSRIDNRVYCCSPRKCMNELSGEIEQLAFDADMRISKELKSTDVTVTMLGSPSEFLRDKLQERELFSRFMVEVHRP